MLICITQYRSVVLRTSVPNRNLWTDVYVSMRQKEAECHPVHMHVNWMKWTVAIYVVVITFGTGGGGRLWVLGDIEQLLNENNMRKFALMFIVNLFDHIYSMEEK